MLRGAPSPGATVVLACRNREKGEAVKQEIARATGNNSLIKRKEAKSSARSQDKELAARLWKVSAELTGLKV